MITIEIRHADLNACRYTFTASIGLAKAKRSCREWANDNGYYGAVIRKV